MYPHWKLSRPLETSSRHWGPTLALLFGLRVHTAPRPRGSNDASSQTTDATSQRRSVSHIVQRSVGRPKIALLLRDKLKSLYRLAQGLNSSVSCTKRAQLSSIEWLQISPTTYLSAKAVFHKIRSPFEACTRTRVRWRCQCEAVVCPWARRFRKPSSASVQQVQEQVASRVMSAR